jgi:hypothetical protein
MGRGVIIRTVINGMTFDGATTDPIAKAVRDALIGHRGRGSASRRADEGRGAAHRHQHRAATGVAREGRSGLTSGPPSKDQPKGAARWSHWTFKGHPSRRDRAPPSRAGRTSFASIRKRSSTAPARCAERYAPLRYVRRAQRCQGITKGGGRLGGSVVYSRFCHPASEQGCWW